MIILIRTCLNFCMFDWSVKNGDKSGKSHGILISCVSGNSVPDTLYQTHIRVKYDHHTYF